MPQNGCDGSDDVGQVSLAGVENFESKKFSCRGAQAGLSPGTDREVRTILEIMARWTILVVITVIISIVTILLTAAVITHPKISISGSETCLLTRQSVAASKPW